MAHPVEEWTVTNTTWYSEELEIGNHYSNWNGLGTYAIDGDDGSIDLYPFIDFDEDSLTEYYEVIIYLTDPFNSDSDGDDYSDGEEIAEGFDPLDNSDHPSIFGDIPYYWLIGGLAGGFVIGLLVAIMFRTKKGKTKTPKKKGK